MSLFLFIKADIKDDSNPAVKDFSKVIFSNETEFLNYKSSVGS